MWRALLAGLAVAVVACDGGEVTVEPTTGPGEQPVTLLTITVDAGDGSTPAVWTLQCDPSGGTHPDPEAACRALASLDPAVLVPVPPDAVCTQVFGGPGTATVRGVWDGLDVDASFTRTNGCEIARWDAVAALFPSVSNTAPRTP